MIVKVHISITIVVGRSGLMFHQRAPLYSLDTLKTFFISFAREFACAPFPVNCGAVCGIVARPTSQ